MTAEELIESRSYTLTKDGIVLTALFHVFGTDDPWEAVTLLPLFGSQLNDNGILRPIFVTDISLDQVPPSDMRATVTYGKPESSQNDPPEPEANKATWRLSGLAQSVHIETGVDIQKHFPNDAEFKGEAIGVTPDGAQGVDVLRPHSTLTIDHWLTPDAATPAFIDAITELGGTVNTGDFAGPWGEWKTKEVLYHGPEISAVNANLIQITHTFERSRKGTIKIKIENQAGAPEIVINKEGWEYFWTRIADSRACCANILG